MRAALVRHGAVAVLLGLGLTISGCSSDGGAGLAQINPASTRPLPRSATRSATTPGATPHRGLAHIVIIVEENKPATSILGNGAAPYVNRVASQFAVATNYSAVTHPSLPNYLALTGGSTAGISTDCSPGPGCLVQAPSIASEIEASGRSWRMYAEGMPAPCTATSSGLYAVKHNPFLYHPSVTDDTASCRAHDVPFTQFDADLKRTSTLADYSFISPNLCDDMHDCSVQTGDTWLSREVPAILGSPAFTKQNSLLVITWDEGDSGSNVVPAIFAGPAAKAAYTSHAPFGHYSLLYTIEKAWSLAPLTGNDAGAPVMDGLLR